MGKIKNEQMPLVFTIVSSDIKSLFTSVQLTQTINFILHRVYNRKEISTILTKNEMKNMLTLCPKYAHFTLNNEIYVQNDGIDIGSPQEPISANAIYGGTRKHIGSQITSICQKMKTLCR